MEILRLLGGYIDTLGKFVVVLLRDLVNDWSMAWWRDPWE